MTRKWTAASLAIATMWLAVLFTGLFAPTLKIVDTAGDSTELPLAGIVVALFAFIATIVVATVGFRGGGPEPR
jgi:hypothetical protein